MLPGEVIIVFAGHYASAAMPYSSIGVGVGVYTELIWQEGGWSCY